MSNSQDIVHDTVTYNQKGLLFIRRKESDSCFDDPKLSKVLILLRKRPMTLIEIKESLEKSDKTIYRYLNKLERAGLVVKAGKRIITTQDNNITTQTLYARTAKVFLPAALYTRIDEKLQEDASSVRPNQVMSIVERLLGQQFKGKKADRGCLYELIKQIDQKKLEYLEKFFNNAEEETIALINEFTEYELEWIVATVGSLAILSEKDWRHAVIKCYER
ncbi:MAG: ArsR family transcriptional regulator [Candidatus Hermodarchaeota archaeon]